MGAHHRPRGWADGPRSPATRSSTRRPDGCARVAWRCSRSPRTRPTARPLSPGQRASRRWKCDPDLAGRPRALVARAARDGGRCPPAGTRRRPPPSPPPSRRCAAATSWHPDRHRLWPGCRPVALGCGRPPVPGQRPASQRRAAPPCGRCRSGPGPGHGRCRTAPAG